VTAASATAGTDALRTSRDLKDLSRTVVESKSNRSCKTCNHLITTYQLLAGTATEGENRITDHGRARANY